MNRILSGTLTGIEIDLVSIETDISLGLISFNIVGLPDNAVKEAKVRVMSSIKHTQIPIPQKRITVNLAPANIRKDGSGFDLPIALGVLVGLGEIKSKELKQYLVAGELSLFGEVRPISGGLSLGIKAKEEGIKKMILPIETAQEAALLPDLEVYGISTLKEMIEFLNGTLDLEPVTPILKEQAELPTGDFQDVKGQYLARRAIEIAVAGRHNILLTGPPGSGKTMLSKRIQSIIPPLTFDEMLETIQIHSAAGIRADQIPNIFIPPFRTPHHSISDSGLIGGGTRPKPGEISMAHNGILFLDELPEFKRSALEGMRQPLEDSTVTITRSQHTITLPADVMIVATMNPCPCGYHGDSTHRCTCSRNEIYRYQKRISGPLMDRIDIVIYVPPVKQKELLSLNDGERSKEIKKRIHQAITRQQNRLPNTHKPYNNRLDLREIKEHCALDQQCRTFLTQALNQLNLSARRYNKILKLARTIADLDNMNHITIAHISEAINLNQPLMI